ncbi:MAG: hypothetical protein WCP14_03120 [bacterium]
MKNITNTKVYWFSILAAVLLVLSGFSYWLSSTIFNETVFVNETVAVMTSQETTQSISAAIVDKSLENNPVVKNLLGDKLKSVLGGLLNTDTFAEVVSGVSGRIYLQITSEHPKGVVLNTLGVKSLVTPILTVVATPEQKSKLEKLNIPDEIVLVDPNSVPTIYPLTNWLWIWPFALVGALALIGYLIYFSDKNARLLNTQKIAAVIAIFGFLATALIPSIEPQIIKNIENYNLRVVASNIYEGLSAPLFNLYLWLLIVPLIVMVGIFGYQLYGKWATRRPKSN